MMQSPKIDVAIIGGGPVGMSLACELHRYGLTFRIVDKAPAPKQYTRAPIFWPRAQEALDLMGLRYLWDGRTVPMRRMNVKVYGRAAGTVALDEGDSPHPCPILVGQDVTEGILDRRLVEMGHPVERSTEATAIVLHDDGATVTLRKSAGVVETVEASWIVGCDGTHSVVRKQTDIGWVGHQLKGLIVSAADAQATWSLPRGDGDAYITLTDAGYMLAIPLPGIWRIIVATPDTTPLGEEPVVTLDEVARRAAAALGGPVALSDPTWVAAVRFGNHAAPTFRKGRALLAGDAAHSIAPLSAQGMNTGIQDAFDLAWKLAYVHKGWSPDTLLDSYTSDRLPVARRLMNSTDRFFSIARCPSTLQKIAMRAAAPVALGQPRLRAKMAKFFTGLDVAYAKSPLNGDAGGSGIQPGTRVSDGMLVQWPEQASRRAYDLLRGLHWTVMVFTGGQADADATSLHAAEVGTIVDRFGPARVRGLIVTATSDIQGIAAPEGVVVAIDAWQALHRHYGCPAGSVFVVRPDLYVAAHLRPYDYGEASRQLARQLRLVTPSQHTGDVSDARTFVDVSEIQAMRPS